jgi:hypothetical protein
MLYHFYYEFYVTYYATFIISFMPCYLQLPMQSVHIATKVSSNFDHGEVYSLQQYVIKLVSDLPQVGGFLQVLLSQ